MVGLVSEGVFLMADNNRYYARSASDKTNDWPSWFVADRERSGLNVTVGLEPSLRGHLPFVPRSVAEQLAERANG